VLASLNHPNIAHIYGVEERALVMELVEGESPKGPMPFDDAWKIALQIADALEYAHERGVIHRDLKPANVKVTPDGVVKLLDFGLAKAFSETPDLGNADPENSPTVTLGATVAGTVLGTAAYMSPEQAKGKKVDKRADIWSWGVVLYELLTGERLFKGGDTGDTLAQVLAKEPPLERVTPQVRKLLGACLQKDPKQRLRDIGDAKRLLAEETVTAPSRSLFGIAMAATLAVVATGLGIGWWRATLPVARPPIKITADIGLGKNPQMPEIRFATGQPGGVFTISPDGARLAAGILDRDGKIRLAIGRLQESQFVPITGTESVVSPFFSPDGQWIAFFADGQLKKVPVQGGAPVPLCPSGLFPAGSWGDDGNIIATLNIQGGLSRIPSAGGAPTPVTELKAGETVHRYPQVLPGSKEVLFTAYSAGSGEDATIEVLSFRTHERKTLVRGEGAHYVATSKTGGYLLYVQRNALLAAPFDAGSLALTGAPQPVLNDLTTRARVDFDVSNTGTLVYMSGGDDPPRSIFWLDSSGKTQPLHAAPGYYATLRFSPDGKRLAFASGDVLGGQDIWAQDLDRDTSVPLTHLPGTNNSPVWTPDSKDIIFNSANHPNPGIYWMRADGSGEPQQLAESSTARFPVSLSPGGKRLAVFDIGRGFATDIWTASYESDPDHPRLGTREPFLRTPPGPAELPTFAMPSFSPDGHWVVYCSGETGESEVYVNAFPSGEKRPVSNSGGRYPLWSRDGRHLFFVGTDLRIYIVDYTIVGDSFVPTKPRQWSSQQILLNPGGGPFQPYDLAPNGKRFAVMLYPNGTAEAQASPRVTFLLNFFDYLRQRVPVDK
jgi:serine/threonine-protein kinase